MRIAVVGGGISGMTAAHLLSDEHEVTLFEANNTIGGHTHTVDVDEEEGPLAVDTGFIVFNEKTYPNFCRLLRRLDVPWQQSDMSFSVQSERRGVEYNGTSINGLFAQRANLVRPSFHRMIRDILRFNREATAFSRDGDAETTLGDFVRRGGYSEIFLDTYLVPMGAAIWSAEPRQMLDFPFRYFARFFDNHGMLTVDERPQWLTVKGGSREYVPSLTRAYRDRIRLASPIAAVRRFDDRVEVTPKNGGPESFDHVVLAAHGDQTLEMLTDANPDERAVLGSFRFQKNDTVLHTDRSVLPKRRRAWASWNYHVDREPSRGVAVTYWMNRLQNLTSKSDFCVSLNREARIDPATVRGRYEYEHPIYTREAVTAQAVQERLNASGRTSFAGAYWGFGFHEDGVNSALAACSRFGKAL